MKCLHSVLWVVPALAVVLSWPVHAGSRDAQWRQVEDAKGKGLPKTAIEHLEPIVQEAIRDKAWGEAVKAVGTKITLEAMIQGGRADDRITRLEAEIPKLPPEMAPILTTVLAHWYWQYYDENRGRFMRRDATAAAPGGDFRSWDLPRLFREIDRLFMKALAEEPLLQGTPIGTYQDLLTPGTVPDSYRPTLYDFVAHEALTFYALGEQAAADPEDAFEPSADSDIFSPMAQFMAWRPDSTDTNSPTLKVIFLYQRLLHFHRADADPSTRLDADLGRFVYAKNVAVGETKNARFKAAMKSMAEKWGDHDLASMALYHWARMVQGEGDLVQARELAVRGEKRPPAEHWGQVLLGPGR